LPEDKVARKQRVTGGTRTVREPRVAKGKKLSRDKELRGDIVDMDKVTRGHCDQRTLLPGDIVDRDKVAKGQN